jgi:hypothetical protein
MAWVDCMRLRRVATIIRAAGWTASGLMFAAGASAAFVFESDPAAAILGMAGGASVIVLAVAYGLAWVVDKRGDSLVTR